MLSRLDLQTEGESTTDERTYFQHWVDADRDSCDTREEVLIAESQTTVSPGDGCQVSRGTRCSSYDGLTWTAASDVDIDHVIALEEAWESGARSWSPADRRRFANDLDDGRALAAVTDNVNASKGDRDPAQWLPPRTGAHCDYATVWVVINYRWRLSIDTAERDRLSSLLSGACGSTTVVVPASAVAAPKRRNVNTSREALTACSTVGAGDSGADEQPPRTSRHTPPRSARGRCSVDVGQIACAAQLVSGPGTDTRHRPAARHSRRSRAHRGLVGGEHDPVDSPCGIKHATSQKAGMTPPCSLIVMAVDLFVTTRVPPPCRVPVGLRRAK